MQGAVDGGRGPVVPGERFPREQAAPRLLPQPLHPFAFAREVVHEDADAFWGKEKTRLPQHLRACAGGLGWNENMWVCCVKMGPIFVLRRQGGCAVVGT